MPNPALEWRNEQAYVDLVDTYAILISANPDNNECSAYIKRIIDALVMPLMQKCMDLKTSQEGKASDELIERIQGYLELIGDFLKGL